MIDVLQQGGYLIFLEEWPCTITFSPYLHYGVAGLLSACEQVPVEVASLSPLFEHLGLYETTVIDDPLPIDSKHSLHCSVYQKGKARYSAVERFIRTSAENYSLKEILDEVYEI